MGFTRQFVNSCHIKFCILVLSLSFISIRNAHAKSFDLADVKSEDEVHFVDSSSSKDQPKMYRADVRDSKDHKLIAVGPFKVSGELRVTDDNCPTNFVTGKACGRDTGRTFGVFLNTTLRDENGEKPIEYRFAFNAQLFTRTAGPTVIGKDGRKRQTVESMEQDRVSAKMVRFDDGYYVVAGVGAEVLTSGDSIARTLQTAFHSIKLARTEKGTFNYVGESKTKVNPDVSAGIGTEQCVSRSSIDLCVIPQVVVQASTRSQNSQVQSSLQASATYKGTSLIAYGEKDYSLKGGGGRVYGIRGEQCVSDHACVFVAVENRRDYLDRYYKGGNKQFVGGIRLRMEPKSAPARVGSVQ